MKTCNCGIFAGSLIVLSLFFFFPSWPAHLCWARHIFPLPLFAFVNSLCRRSPSQTAGEGDTDCRLPASGGTLLLHTCQTSANAPFFPFQPGVDPLKHHARGSFRPEEIKVGMNVTTWAHTELLFFFLIFSRQPLLTHDTWLPRWCLWSVAAPRCLHQPRWWF